MRGGGRLVMAGGRLRGEGGLGGHARTLGVSGTPPSPAIGVCMEAALAAFLRVDAAGVAAAAQDDGGLQSVKKAMAVVMHKTAELNAVREYK